MSYFSRFIHKPPSTVSYVAFRNEPSPNERDVTPSNEDATVTFATPLSDATFLPERRAEMRTEGQGQNSWKIWLIRSIFAAIGIGCIGLGLFCLHEQLRAKLIFIGIVAFIPLLMTFPTIRHHCIVPQITDV